MDPVINLVNAVFYLFHCLDNVPSTQNHYCETLLLNKSPTTVLYLLNIYHSQI